MNARMPATLHACLLGHWLPCRGSCCSHDRRRLSMRAQARSTSGSACSCAPSTSTSSHSWLLTPLTCGICCTMRATQRLSLGLRGAAQLGVRNLLEGPSGTAARGGKQALIKAASVALAATVAAHDTERRHAHVHGRGRARQELSGVVDTTDMLHPDCTRSVSAMCTAISQSLGAGSCDIGVCGDGQGICPQVADASALRGTHCLRHPLHLCTPVFTGQGACAGCLTPNICAMSVFGVRVTAHVYQRVVGDPPRCRRHLCRLPLCVLHTVSGARIPTGLQRIWPPSTRRCQLLARAPRAGQPMAQC